MGGREEWYLASALPTHRAKMTAIMMGRMYSSPPVSSNMITTSDTVMRITPHSMAAAPTMAYIPGVIHSPLPCGVVWCGAVWCGVVWCGVEWCGAMQSAENIRERDVNWRTRKKSPEKRKRKRSH